MVPVFFRSFVFLKAICNTNQVSPRRLSMFKWLFLILTVGFPLNSYTTCNNPALHIDNDGARADPTPDLRRVSALLNNAEKAKEQILEPDFSRPICNNHLRNVNIENLRSNFDATAERNVQTQFNNCLREVKRSIEAIESPSEGEKWYDDYLQNKKYEADFQRYPELERQFRDRMEAAFNNNTSFFGRNHEEAMAVYGPEAWHYWIEAYTKNHPHFKDHTLPAKYNKMLAGLEKDWKERECDPDNQKIKACHEKLKKTLAADNKKGLQAMCGKALQEGQVCCSAPNKSCGDFAFAKDITKAFAKNLPGLGQSFAQIAAMKGDTEEACKLSHLSGLMGGLSGLHLDSCNKAIDGCRDTCDAQLSKFKDAFKSCYKVSKKETVEAVLEKALTEEEETDDPRHDCSDKLKEIAEAYKEITRDSEYALTEESDHEELVACYDEIAKYAPGQQQQSGSAPQGLSPTAALAVNMCYNQTAPGNPYSAPPPGPVVPPEQAPQRGPVSFAGSASNSGGFTPDPDDDIGAPIGDDDNDFIEGDISKQGANELGFKSTSGSPGPGGSAGSGALAGNSGSGKEGKDRGTGRYGAKKTKQVPFYTGDKRDGTSNSNAWATDKEDRRVLRDRDRVRELKKLPKKYLTDEEKDMVKMYSKIGKHESIFERASFALHWFCRNYGCYMYEELMGIPEYVRTKEEP